MPLGGHGDPPGHSPGADEPPASPLGPSTGMFMCAYESFGNSSGTSSTSSASAAAGPVESPTVAEPPAAVAAPTAPGAAVRTLSAGTEPEVEREESPTVSVRHAGRVPRLTGERGYPAGAARRRAVAVGVVKRVRSVCFFGGRARRCTPAQTAAACRAQRRRAPGWRGQHPGAEVSARREDAAVIAAATAGVQAVRVVLDAHAQVHLELPPHPLSASKSLLRHGGGPAARAPQPAAGDQRNDMVVEVLAATDGGRGVGTAPPAAHPGNKPLTVAQALAPSSTGDSPTQARAHSPDDSGGGASGGAAASKPCETGACGTESAEQLGMLPPATGVNPVGRPTEVPGAEAPSGWLVPPSRTSPISAWVRDAPLVEGVIQRTRTSRARRSCITRRVGAAGGPGSTLMVTASDHGPFPRALAARALTRPREPPGRVSRSSRATTLVPPSPVLSTATAGSTVTVYRPRSPADVTARLARAGGSRLTGKAALWLRALPRSSCLRIALPWASGATHVTSIASAERPHTAGSTGAAGTVTSVATRSGSDHSVGPAFPPASRPRGANSPTKELSGPIDETAGCPPTCIAAAKAGSTPTGAAAAGAPSGIRMSRTRSRNMRAGFRSRSAHCVSLPRYTSRQGDHAPAAELVVAFTAADGLPTGPAVTSPAGAAAVPSGESHASTSSRAARRSAVGGASGALKQAVVVSDVGSDHGPVPPSVSASRAHTLRTRLCVLCTSPSTPTSASPSMGTACGKEL
eukprot:scaffold912_cov108-Isochrysis_galbana.AAC.15